MYSIIHNYLYFGTVWFSVGQDVNYSINGNVVHYIITFEATYKCNFFIQFIQMFLKKITITVTLFLPQLYGAATPQWFEMVPSVIKETISHRLRTFKI